MQQVLCDIDVRQRTEGSKSVDLVSRQDWDQEWNYSQDILDYLSVQSEKESNEVPFGPYDKDMLHLRLNMATLEVLSFYEVEDSSKEKSSRLSQLLQQYMTLHRDFLSRKN